MQVQNFCMYIMTFAIQHLYPDLAQLLKFSSVIEAVYDQEKLRWIPNLVLPKIN